MLKNYKGFTLLEVMMSLFLLTSVMIMIFPVIRTYYVESRAIREKETSLQILTNELNRWILTDRKAANDVIINHVQYHFSWESDTNQARLCVTWTGANRRSYVQCGSAKQYY